jgi:hypothetical protein
VVFDGHDGKPDHRRPMSEPLDDAVVALAAASAA